MISKEQVKTFFKEKALDKITVHTAEILASEDEEIKYLLALAWFHQKNFSEAEKIFLLMAEKQDNSSTWFNVSTVAALNKNFVLAENAYHKTLQLQPYEEKPIALAPSMITFMYLRALSDAENYAAAFPLLEKMKNFYKAIFVSNDQHLVVSGLPALKDFFQSAKIIFMHTADKTLVKNWFADFKSGVDAEGKEKLSVFEKEWKALK